MAQEMSFAQALTEARQIIVQQSNRIRSDLEKIKASQETVAAQAATIATQERSIHEQAAQLSQLTDDLNVLTVKLNETIAAREQAETIIDRQGQRLTQSQSMIDSLEKQISDHLENIGRLTDEVAELRQSLPTEQDNEALLAITQLLTTKKVSVPATPAFGSLRIPPSEQTAAA